MSLEMMGITWNYKGNSQEASYQLYSYHCQAARFFSHSQDEDLLYVLLQQELRVFDLGDRPGEASKVVPRHLWIGDSMGDQQPVVIILVGGLEHEIIFFHILGIVTPTDELIFFRGVETTNQYKIESTTISLMPEARSMGMYCDIWWTNW